VIDVPPPNEPLCPTVVVRTLAVAHCGVALNSPEIATEPFRGCNVAVALIPFVSSAEYTV
jgi:hypothetical protein